MTDQDPRSGLVERLRSQVLQVDADADEHEDPEGGRWWRLVAAFEYGDLTGTADVVVSVAPPEEVVGELALPVHDAQLDLLQERADRAGIDVDLHIDEDAEIALLIVARDAGPDPSVTALLDQLRGDVVTLIEAAVVELVHVPDLDPTFGADADALVALKAADPLAAVDLLADMAERARRHAAFATAAYLALAGSELLADMGRAREAVEVAEPAWDLLGRPIDHADLSISYAAALGRFGRIEEARDLLEAAIAEAEDPSDRASLIGSLGALLANTGARAEAIDLLAAALEGQMLDDEARVIVRTNLDVLRAVPLTPAPERAAPDAAAGIDRAILDVGIEWFGMAATQRAHALPGALARLDDLDRRWDQLSDGQRVELLLVRVQLVAPFDPARAGADLDRARTIAADNGDATSLRHVEATARLVGSTERDAPTGDAWEAMAVCANRVARELAPSLPTPNPGQLERWRADLRSVLADGRAEFAAFRDLRDRRRWRADMARGYELALFVAHLAGDPEEVIEMLGLLRDQGRPARDGEAGSLEASILDNEDLRRLLRQPTILAVADVEEHPPPARLARSTTGAAAWWWTSAIIDRRLHWALRSPDGAAWSGVEALPPTPLWPTDDLRALTDLVLPKPLREATVAAAEGDVPIRIACALAGELAAVPIAALPVGDGRLVMNGAITAIAPPSWLLGEDIVRRPPAIPPEVALALGADRELGDLVALVEPFRVLTRSPVLGEPLQVAAGTAAALATSAATATAWGQEGTGIGVFYGHIKPGSRSAPLSGGLLLSDERGYPATWTVQEMLRAKAELAHTVVLAGCSSLGLPGDGAAEWWGPACGMLANGSTFVIGTRWAVQHDAANVAFVVDLVGELQRRPGDAPAALWRTQRRWRDRTEPSDRDGPPPWSAYAVVGAATTDSAST